ncbi:dUTP diphosphatase [Ruminococcus sp. AF12-5]|nr:dUTP diphosphatase [Ruminococcus sp. AF12-5]
MARMNIKKINTDSIVPTKGSDDAAGLDLYAYIPRGAIDIPAGTTIKIGTGIATEIPTGCFGAVFARSGLATKRGLRPSNCVGVVDSDYRGEVIVALHNDSDKCETIHHGDRIAQLVIMPYISVRLCEVDELSNTERGSGGFGSTGISL